MKKIISVVLCALLLFSCMAAGASAAALTSPADVDASTLAFTSEGVVSWAAAADADSYQVQLYVWSYDGKIGTWTWVPCSDVITVDEYAADVKEFLKDGYYTFSVRARHDNEITKADGEIVKVPYYSAWTELPSSPYTEQGGNFNTALNSNVIKYEPTYAWEEPIGDGVFDDLLPEDVKESFSIIRFLANLFQKFYQFLMSFASVREIVA